MKDKIYLKRLFSCFLCTLLCAVNLKAQDTQQRELNIPLNNSAGLTISGPYRFIEVAGLIGLHVTSLNTKASVNISNVLNSARGTVSFWMSPLENMDVSREAGPSPEMMTFPLISDKFPARQSAGCNFSVYYEGSGYPRVIARFTAGSFWGQMDYGLAPFVYAENLPLQKGQWYNFTISWDKESRELIMYINGQMVGHNYSAKNFNETGDKLYIGNPLMVISHLKILNSVLSADQVKMEYLSMRPVSNLLSDESISRISTPQILPGHNTSPDYSWEKIYECRFNKQSHLNPWKFQTGELFYDKFILQVTNDGLYWKTPDSINTESRGYLWCPVILEGECCVEYEFKLLSPNGLSLLIIYASGMQGEDVIEDHGLKKTGSMGDMLNNYRNYHWEYVRRVEAMRTDVETQYVKKNPWGKSLFVGCIPRLEQNSWHKISITKSGSSLYGMLDGNTVFDVTDNPSDNNGPVFNSGRVVLRQMYQTAMLYRNFVIYRKME